MPDVTGADGPRLSITACSPDDGPAVAPHSGAQSAPGLVARLSGAPSTSEAAASTERR